MVLNLKDNFRTRESAFSYQCHACNKCCYGKGIQVNPYETMRLSGLLGIATTEFRQKYLKPANANAQNLIRMPAYFLGENGCTVHKDRPLVLPVVSALAGFGSTMAGRFLPNLPRILNRKANTELRQPWRDICKHRK
jgi:hypothetical protein